MTFQTPPDVVRYMVDMIPDGTISVLEPTPGDGNIVSQLQQFLVTAPDDYFKLSKKQQFDCVIMNPPFSSKYAYGVPDHLACKGMKVGYHILYECMTMSDHIIALMPWFLLLDSTPRTVYLKQFGLKSITALPRSTFKYARIQTCILELVKGWQGDTIYHVFNMPK